REVREPVPGPQGDEALAVGRGLAPPVTSMERRKLSYPPDRSTSVRAGLVDRGGGPPAGRSSRPGCGSGRRLSAVSRSPPGSPSPRPPPAPPACPGGPPHTTPPAAPPPR